MALTSLLVCADSKAVELLSRSLADLGIEVRHCDDAASATTQLKQDHFDTILIDCKDQSSAIQFIESVRQSVLNPHALVIAIVDGENNVREVFGTGANFVLYKPVSHERAKNSLRAVRAAMRNERRRRPRTPVDGEATIDYGNVENVTTTLLDLGEEGTAIQCDRRLPPSCKVYFQFTLPGEVSLVRLSGEVVWQDSAGRVGIRFAGVPQSSRRILNQWLKQGAAPRPEPSASITLHSEVVAPPVHRGSPPGGLGLLSVSGADRRIQSRHACRLGADVYRMGSAVPNRCSLSDISMGGCYIETTSPFTTGTPVEILVRTKDMKLRTRGVVQAMHPGYGMGVRFNLKTADERDQVHQLIFLLSQSQASEPGFVVEPW